MELPVISALKMCSYRIAHSCRRDYPRTRSFMLGTTERYPRERIKEIELVSICRNIAWRLAFFFRRFGEFILRKQSGGTY